MAKQLKAFSFLRWEKFHYCTNEWLTCLDQTETLLAKTAGTSGLLV